MIGVDRRRVMGNPGHKEDQSSIEGFLFGYRLNMNGPIEQSACCITRYYDVNPGDSLLLKAFAGNYPGINLGYGYSDGTTYKHISWCSTDSVIDIPQNGILFRATLVIKDLDDCYIFNKTTGKYLFKGKNTI